MSDNEWDKPDIEAAKADVREVYEEYRQYWQDVIARSKVNRAADSDDYSSKVRDIYEHNIRSSFVLRPVPRHRT